MRAIWLVLAAAGFGLALSESGVREDQQHLSAASDSSEEKAAWSDKLCNICKTSIGGWVNTPVSASLSISCNGFSSNAIDFAQCRMVYLQRLTALVNLRNNGCYVNSNGVKVLQKPCTTSQAICSGLAIYTGAGAAPTTEAYCPEPDGVDPFPGFGVAAVSSS